MRNGERRDKGKRRGEVLKERWKGYTGRVEGKGREGDVLWRDGGKG